MNANEAITMAENAIKDSKNPRCSEQTRLALIRESIAESLLAIAITINEQLEDKDDCN